MLKIKTLFLLLTMAIPSQIQANKYITPSSFKIVDPDDLVRPFILQAAAPEMMTYLQAEAYCESQGSELASSAQLDALVRALGPRETLGKELVAISGLPNAIFWGRKTTKSFQGVAYFFQSWSSSEDGWFAMSSFFNQIGSERFWVRCVRPSD